MARVFTGNTGGSTGPHLDARVYDTASGSYIDPRPFVNRFLAAGKPVNEAFQETSGYGMRTHPIHGDQRMHHGVDYATPEGTPLEFQGGTFLGYKKDSGGGGVMAGWGFTDERGRNLEAWALHLKDPGPDAPVFKGGRSAGGGAIYKPAGAASSATASSPASAQMSGQGQDQGQDAFMASLLRNSEAMLEQSRRGLQATNNSILGLQSQPIVLGRPGAAQVPAVQVLRPQNLGAQQGTRVAPIVASGDPEPERDPFRNVRAILEQIWS